MKKYKLQFQAPLFAFLLTLLVQCHPAFTQVVRMSLEDLANQSETIISATVLSTRSQWVESEGGRNIITLATMKVEKVIKGHIGPEFTLETLGGRIGDTTQYVTHSIQLSQGEEAIFFLVNNPYRVVGGFQGKITVTNNNVLFQGQVIPRDIFMNKLSSYLLFPQKPIEFDTIPQKLRIDPNSPKQEEKTIELPEQEPQKLKVDHNSLKQEEKTVEPINQQPQKLKVDPKSPKQEEKTIEPPEQEPQKLKVDHNSLKQEEKTVEPTNQQPQKLKIDPKSPKQEEKTKQLPNQHPKKLRVVPSKPAPKDTTKGGLK